MERIGDGKRRKEVGRQIKDEKFCNQTQEIDGRGIHGPLRLLALHWTGRPPIAVELCSHEAEDKADCHRKIDRAGPIITIERRTGEEIFCCHQKGPPEHHPDHPAGHEPSIGKESKGEKTNITQELYAHDRKQPDRVRLLQIHLIKTWVPYLSHESEHKQEHHPVIRPVPEEHCCDHDPDQVQRDETDEVEYCIAIERQAEGMEHLYACKAELSRIAPIGDAHLS